MNVSCTIQQSLYLNASPGDCLSKNAAVPRDVSGFRARSENLENFNCAGRRRGANSRREGPSRKGRSGAGQMDVFKLAFETPVVGLLAFLWLGVATYLLFPDFLTDLLFRRVPEYAKDNQTLLGVGVLTLAYCLGSAVLPIANQLVNDEHWPLPENAIRCQVFTKQERQLEDIGYTVLPKYLSLNRLELFHCSYWAPILEGRIGQRIWTFVRLWAPFPTGNEDPTAKADEAKKDKILSLFQMLESKILNQGTDKAEQLRQLHERIVVLRGAVFSGFSFLLICVFAWIAPINGKAFPWKERVPGTLLAVLLTAFSVVNGFADLTHFNI